MSTPGVRCPKCNVESAVPGDARAWRCPNCQQLWLFPNCQQCGLVQFVGAEREHDWACPDCRRRNRTGSTSSKARGAAAAVVSGAIVAAVGTASPWLTVGALDRSGFSFAEADAVTVLVIAVAAALGAIAQVAGWELPSFIKPSVVIIGAVTVTIGIYDAVQVQHRVHDIRHAAAGLVSVQASIGAGLWLVIAGGAITFLSGVALARNRRGAT